MKKKEHWYWLTVTFIVAVGIAMHANSNESQSRLDDQSSVRAVVEGMIAADNAGDLDGILEYYADDAVLIFPGGDDIVGIDDIRSHYERLFATVDLNIQSNIDEIVVSGDLAIVRGTNYVVTTTVDETSHARSKYLMSLRRKSDRTWHVAHLMWSNQPVPAE